TSEKRTVTTVPLQQLFVLNSDFMIRRAKELAARLSATAGDDPSRIREAYWLLYGRPALEEEVEVGLEFLKLAQADAAGESTVSKSALSRWEQYAQALLGSNEFTFVD
ncbi:MAG: DUF1553 domain-containing protein, partial [Planctomycetaceae bacterium]